MMSFRKRRVIFAQGDASDAVFVIQKGLVTLSGLSIGGKETTIDIIDQGDFVGKGTMAGEDFRWMTATALTDCWLLRIEKTVMTAALAVETQLASVVCAHVLARNLRYMQDLVELRSTSCEHRLAQILIRLARLEAAPSEATIPKIDQSTLAAMVGTTRSRVSYFMNSFRASGFIHYTNKGEGLRVHSSLRDHHAHTGRHRNGW